MPDKPVLDEKTFQQLLAAAYVLQQENQRQTPKEVRPDPAQILAGIVETQGLIHNQQLDLPTAAMLVAEKAREFTAAAGALVGVLEGEQLRYCAAAGSAGEIAGSRVAIASSLANASIVQGKAVRVEETLSEPDRARAELVRRLGIRSLIVAPVRYEGKVAAVLELHSGQANFFGEEDFRSCQLLAGLLSEAVGRSIAEKSKERVAEAAAAKPTVAQAQASPAQAESSAAAPAWPGTAEAAPVATRSEAAGARPTQLNLLDEAPAAEKPKVSTRTSRGKGGGAGTTQATEAFSPSSTCQGCGNVFDNGEFFCGICGTPRSVAPGRNETQSEWASLWQLQQIVDEKIAEHAENGFEARAGNELDPLPPALLEIARQFDAEEAQERTLRGEAEEAEFVEEEAEEQAHVEVVDGAIRIIPAESQLPVKAEPRYPWTSAASAKQWLEDARRQGSDRKWLLRQWRRWRATAYLVLSGLLLVAVLATWGSHSNPPAPVNSRHKTPPPPELSLFEKTLIWLGVAEAPPTPVYTGNPDTQVWVDVHTALYYCPGNELFGKSQGGKTMTQREAQMEAFEPANRRVCD